LTFQVATMPIGGPALTVTGVTSTFDEMLKEKSPTDLKIVNRKTLLALGANGKETERFLNNNAFSPSEQTAFVLNLRSLNGVANRGAFVRTAGETSSDESDAIFCVQTAALMSKIHKDKPLFEHRKLRPNSGSHEQNSQGQAARSPADDGRLSDRLHERRHS